MNGALLLVVLCVILVCLGATELVLHQRRLSRIPIRIHINGTRGKSSVTRLVAAGLRAGGIRCVAKTTGTLPRLIFTDGAEQPLFRWSKPNIIEQVRVVAEAARQGADALVVECMALQPELQWLCEAKLLCATHGVITNVRPDHLEVMGPTEEDVALALAATTPRSGTLLTTEQRHLQVLRVAAQDRRTHLVEVNEEAISEITEQTLSRFSYREHAENVAVALAVCTFLGVERERALSGMCKALPDPGALTEHHLDFFGRRIVFVNGFAANDPVSTGRIWNQAMQRHGSLEQHIAVFNCRADRPERSQQLAEAYVQWPSADYVVVMGSGSYVFAREAVRWGVDPNRLVFAESAHVDEIFEVIIGLVKRSALVMGLGNVGGQGLDLASYFAHRAAPPEPHGVTTDSREDA